MDGNLLGPVSIALAQSVSSFQFFLPRLSDVRKASTNDPDMIGDVRLGEVAAISMCTAVGAITSALTKSSVPMFVSLVVSGVLIGVYETALRGDRPGNPKDTLRYA